MPSKQLIDAIRTGTAEEINDVIHQQGLVDGSWDDRLAEAIIVATRAKPEDVVTGEIWMVHPLSPCAMLVKCDGRVHVPGDRVTITREPK